MPFELSDCLSVSSVLSVVPSAEISVSAAVFGHNIPPAEKEVPPLLSVILINVAKKGR